MYFTQYLIIVNFTIYSIQNWGNIPQSDLSTLLQRIRRRESSYLQRHCAWAGSRHPWQTLPGLPLVLHQGQSQSSQTNQVCSQLVMSRTANGVWWHSLVLLKTLENGARGQSANAMAIKEFGTSTRCGMLSPFVRSGIGIVVIVFLVTRL